MANAVFANGDSTKTDSIKAANIAASLKSEEKIDLAKRRAVNFFKDAFDQRNDCIDRHLNDGSSFMCEEVFIAFLKKSIEAFEEYATLFDQYKAYQTDYVIIKRVWGLSAEDARKIAKSQKETIAAGYKFVASPSKETEDVLEVLRNKTGELFKNSNKSAFDVAIENALKGK